MVEKKADLRYGENPHQLGAFYADPAQYRTSISRARQIAGKDLSFNNLLDLDAAWQIASDFKTPTVCIVKHGNPCGLASVVDLAEAFRLALEGDSVSAYGGIIGANRVVDDAAARAIRPGFFEAIVAPGYTPEALEILRTKKGFEIIEVPQTDADGPELGIGNFDFKRIGGGLLVQTFDNLEEDRNKLQVVTQRRPTLDELTDLLFAWRAVRHVKSNAIVLAKRHALIGMGAGQPSRVVSASRSPCARPASGLPSRSWPRRLLPLPRWNPDRGAGRGDGDHPAGRQHPRRDGDRGGRPPSHGDGLHRAPPLQALSDP